MGAWANNVETFLDSTVAGDELPRPEEYIRGTQRINFYAEQFDREDRLSVEDDATEYLDYESALYARLHTPHSSPLVIIGGIGSGKSSSIRHVVNLIANQNHQRPGVAPIVLDAIPFDRSDSVEQVLRRLYRVLCNASLGQLIARTHGPAADLNKIGHRTLLLCNDIFRWSVDEECNFEFPFDPDLSSEFRVRYLDDPDSLIIATQLGPDSTLVNKIRSLRRHLSIEHYHSLCQCVLSFLVEHSTHEPVTSKCIIIDNIDQLATNDIQQLFSRLRRIKNEVPGIELIVPLRPSSIASRGYTRNSTFIYHYGPNCFDLMLGRCIRHILSCSEEEIKKKAFARPPTEEDMTLLMVATHIYASLLEAGASISSQEAFDYYHSDHHWLASLVVLTDDRGRMVKQILNALIGTSARYAIRHASRFFSRADQNRNMFLEYARTARASAQRGLDSRPVKVRFGDLVDAALAITSRTGTNEDHCINVYKPLRGGPNREWPSLVMLRVLFLLLEQRERALLVSELVAELARYGIPGEVTLEAIDYLRIEDRHLCWISSNKDAALSMTPSDLSLYVMISEQGAEYARSLCGNFEYVWLCGRDLQQQNTKVTFLSRLNAYRLLVSRLLDIEWKQIVFYLTARDRLPVPDDGLSSGFFISLRIALKTASEAIEAIVKSATRRTERLFRNEQPLESYLQELDPVLLSMLECIITAATRHVMSFGSRGFRAAYSMELEGYTRAAQQFRQNEIFSRLNARRELDLINALFSSFPTSAHTGLAVAPVSLMRPPKDDAVTKAAELLNRLPPVLGGGIGRNAGLAALVEIEKESYERAEESLKNIFSRRLPVFSEVRQAIAKLKRHAGAVVSSSQRRGVEVQTGSYNWYREAEERWSDYGVKLEELAYTVDPDKNALAQVTEAKGRCNRILAIYLEIARFIGVTHEHHLEVHWTEAR